MHTILTLPRQAVRILVLIADLMLYFFRLIFYILNLTLLFCSKYICLYVWLPSALFPPLFAFLFKNWSFYWNYPPVLLWRLNVCKFSLLLFGTEPHGHLHHPPAVADSFWKFRHAVPAGEWPHRVLRVGVRGHPLLHRVALSLRVRAGHEPGRLHRGRGGLLRAQLRGPHHLRGGAGGLLRGLLQFGF